MSYNNNSSSSLPRDYYFSFPWLNGSSNYLYGYLGLQSEEELETEDEYGYKESNQQDLANIIRKLFQTFPRLITVLRNLLSNIVENIEELPIIDSPELKLAMYPVAQIILSIIDNRLLSNGFRNIYAKHLQTELTGSTKGAMARKVYTDNRLLAICDNLKIQCELCKKEIDDKVYKFKMSIPSYLKVSVKMHLENWKLINRYVLDGYVYLERSDIILLLREFVRDKITPPKNLLSDELIEKLKEIPAIKEILEYVEALIETHAKRFKSNISLDGEVVGYQYFPPCMKSILYRIQNGENLGHTERLAIAFFYLNTNHSIEETVDLFRTSPDFDESIARYQVEFIAGDKSDEVKYNMYSCAKLKTFGLCKASDPDFGEPLCEFGYKKKDGTRVSIRNPAWDYIFYRKLLEKRNKSRFGAHEALVEASVAETDEKMADKTADNKINEEIPNKTNLKTDNKADNR